MVASEATNLACRSLQLDSIVTRAEKLTSMDNQPNLSREVNRQWAGSREPRRSGRGGAFFLTSLFIELIDRDFGEQTAQAGDDNCDGSEPLELRGEWMSIS